MAEAEKKAREIERSAPTTAHVAEERVMDYVGGSDKGGEDEEDKYVPPTYQSVRRSQLIFLFQIQWCTSAGLPTPHWRRQGKQVHTASETGTDRSGYC